MNFVTFVFEEEVGGEEKRINEFGMGSVGPG